MKAANGLRACIALRAGLPVGHAANVAACIAAGLAHGAEGLAGQALCDADGRESLSSATLPIAILGADDAGLAALWRRAADAVPTGRCVLFPHYAQAMHGVEDYWAAHAAARHSEQPLLGIGLVGPQAWVRRLTGALPLLR